MSSLTKPHLIVLASTPRHFSLLKDKFIWTFFIHRHKERCWWQWEGFWYSYQNKSSTDNKKRNRATLILGIYIMKYYFPVNGKHGFPRRLFDISVLRQKCQQCSVTAAAKTYTVHYWMWTRSGEISETRSVSWHHFSEWRICVFEELRVMEVMSHWCGALESRRYTFLFFSASN